MKIFKKALRLLALALIIGLASVLPVPITFYKKDEKSQYIIEQIDKKEQDAENEDIKELF